MSPVGARRLALAMPSWFHRLTMRAGEVPYPRKPGASWPVLWTYSV